VVQQGPDKLLADAPQNERVRGGGRGPAPGGPAPTADYDAIWPTSSAAGPACPITCACRPSAGSRRPCSTCCKTHPRPRLEPDHPRPGHRPNQTARALQRQSFKAQLLHQPLRAARR
jgi:hypothetical protein